MKIGKLTVTLENGDNVKIHFSNKLKDNVIKYLVFSGLISTKISKNDEIVCSLSSSSGHLKIVNNSNGKECNLNFRDAFNDISNMQAMHPIHQYLSSVKEGEMFTVTVLCKGERINDKVSKKYVCINIPKYGYYNITLKERLYTTYDRELDDNSKWRNKNGKLNYKVIKDSCLVTLYKLED